VNGVHDMGGSEGFGPIVLEAGEPVFHHPWEGRILALTIAMAAWRTWSIDARRHERELIEPATYLRMSYYERWLAALESLVVKSGLVTPAEVRNGRSHGGPKMEPALPVERVRPLIARGSPYDRDVDLAPRFAAGDAIRTKNIHPHGHTRLPRYARGRRGTIARDHGVHVFPDTSAHGLGESPQHVYSVRFAATELWGTTANPRDSVHIDLWDDYLEPA
jgi:nitrile hydratase subunit beta